MAGAEHGYPGIQFGFCAFNDHEVGVGEKGDKVFDGSSLPFDEGERLVIVDDRPAGSVREKAVCIRTGFIGNFTGKPMTVMLDDGCADSVRRQKRDYRLDESGLAAVFQAANANGFHGASIT